MPRGVGHLDMVIADSDFLLENQMKIPYGYCYCGCGKKTSIAPSSRRDKDWVKGKPLKYTHGHNARTKAGHGYLSVLLNGKRLKVHRVIIEKAIGKSIPKRAVTHHIDGGRRNNKNSNLVLCEDNAYHRLLHVRIKALKESGHVDWIKCHYCGKWDDPINLYTHYKGSS